MCIFHKWVTVFIDYGITIDVAFQKCKKCGRRRKVNMP